MWLLSHSVASQDEHGSSGPGCSWLVLADIRNLKATRPLTPPQPQHPTCYLLLATCSQNDSFVQIDIGPNLKYIAISLRSHRVSPPHANRRHLRILIARRRLWKPMDEETALNHLPLPSRNLSGPAPGAIYLATAGRRRRCRYPTASHGCVGTIGTIGSPQCRAIKCLRSARAVHHAGSKLG